MSTGLVSLTCFSLSPPLQQEQPESKQRGCAAGCPSPGRGPRGAARVRAGADQGDGGQNPQLQRALGEPLQVSALIKLTRKDSGPAGTPFQRPWWWWPKKTTGRTAPTSGAPKWSTPMRYEGPSGTQAGVGRDPGATPRMLSHLTSGHHHPPASQQWPQHHKWHPPQPLPPRPVPAF